MTLTETLQIESRFLQSEDMRRLDRCEKRFQQEGRPTGKWPMVNFLEKMIQELTAARMGYPPVLLLRKKQIQRGEFAINSHTRSSECPCTGGWRPDGTPCSCGKGDQPRAELAKLGLKV